METGHPSTRAVNSGSGNRALERQTTNQSINQPTDEWVLAPKMTEKQHKMMNAIEYKTCQSYEMSRAGRAKRAS